MLALSGEVVVLGLTYDVVSATEIRCRPTVGLVTKLQQKILNCLKKRLFLGGPT